MRDPGWIGVFGSGEAAENSVTFGTVSAVAFTETTLSSWSSYTNAACVVFASHFQLRTEVSVRPSLYVRWFVADWNRLPEFAAPAEFRNPSGVKFLYDWLSTS